MIDFWSGQLLTIKTIMAFRAFTHLLQILMQDQVGNASLFPLITTLRTPTLLAISWSQPAGRKSFPSLHALPVFHSFSPFYQMN